MSVPLADTEARETTNVEVVEDDPELEAAAFAASELDYLVQSAFEKNDREVLARIGDALQVVRGVAGVKPHLTARRRAYRAEVEHLVAQLRERRVLPLPGDIARRFAERFDPIFSAFSSSRVREIFLDVDVAGDGRGGSGNRGPMHVAALLAVEANALGFGVDPALLASSAPDRRAKLIKEAVAAAKESLKNLD